MKRFINSLILYFFRRGEYLSKIELESKTRKKYSIPESFRFNGTNILIYGSGKLIIGENSYIGSFSTIQIQDNYMVKIGSNCKISHNVRMYTTSNITDQNFNGENIVGYSENVIIGNGVWIGANVFINPGIIIGDNSIIGANSVITKDIPENAIFGGVPARLIRFKEIHD